MSFVGEGEQHLFPVGVEVIVRLQLTYRLQDAGDVVGRLPQRTPVVEGKAGGDPARVNASAVLRVEEVGEDLVFHEGEQFVM